MRNELVAPAFILVALSDENVHREALGLSGRSHVSITVTDKRQQRQPRSSASMGSATGCALVFLLHLRSENPILLSSQLKCCLEQGVFRLELGNHGFEPIAFLRLSASCTAASIAVKSLFMPQIPMTSPWVSRRGDSSCSPRKFCRQGGRVSRFFPRAVLSFS